MAFDGSKFNVIDQLIGGKYRRAIYLTPDPIATVDNATYFTKITDWGMKEGDVIDVVETDQDPPKVTRTRLTTVSAAGAGTVTVEAGEGANPVAGTAAGFVVARGQHTTVAASDTVVTGLTTVSVVVAQLDSDPVDGAMHVTSSIGDQAGAPAAGSVLIKTWKSTDGDATLIAATTFSLKVNWIAIGA